MRAKMKNLLTGNIFGVHSTTDSIDSSYGLECWVDDEGNSYGQCQFGAPIGFELLPAGRGGPARGQGRKKKDPLLKKKARSIRLPKWVWDEIDKMDDNSHVVLLDAVITRHKLKQPK